MNFASVGDLSRFFTSRRANAALRTDIQRLSKEVTTGIRADVPGHLNGDFLDLGRLEQALREAGAYRQTAREAAVTASGMQAAFGTLQEIADMSSARMLSDTALAVEHSLLSLASDADGQLGTAIAALNTNIGGRFVLSGTKANTPPLVSAEELVGQAQSVIAGAATADEAIERLRNWFDAAPGAGGFADTAYRGSLGAGSPFGIDASNTIRFGQTANDPGVRNTLLGLTLGALISRGSFSGDQASQAAMMRAGGAALIKGNAGLTLARSDLGSSEQVIERASLRLDSLTTGLNTERNNLIAVDPYESGSQLVRTEATLEALYAMTARLSKLSLAKYL